MTPVAIVIVVAFLGAGLITGWHAQRAVISHNDIKVGHQRVRNGRKARWRSGVIALAVGILLVIAIWDFLTAR